MPLYEYLCPACGTFEELVSVAAAGDPARCPSCAAPAARSYSFALGSSASIHGGARSAGDRERMERAHAGEPTTQRVERAGTSQSGHGHGRPWMIGH